MSCHIGSCGFGSNKFGRLKDWTEFLGFTKTPFDTAKEKEYEKNLQEKKEFKKTSRIL